MKRKFAITGAIFVVLDVILGAFGAHALRDVLGDSGTVTWKTAVLYQFVHGISLIALGSYAGRLPSKKMNWTLVLFSLGIILFSGSLYLLATSSNTSLRSFMGPLTPLGGLCFIIGWLVFIFAQLTSAPLSQHDS